MGVKSSSFHAIAKADRHGYTRNLLFHVSFSEAETTVMQSLPEPIRQAFMTAKAVRLASVCVAGLDLKQFNIVEDLAIEEYITSHTLKNCLLSVLKTLWLQNAKSSEPKSEQLDLFESEVTNTFSATICKFILADSIYFKYKYDLIMKVIYAYMA